jgi:hypothetical protein
MTSAACFPPGSSAAVFFFNKHGALSCLVRDLSAEGARIIFSENVTVPETFDLHILQKNQTLRARVTWRRGEIAALRKMLKRMKGDPQPLDDEAAA